MSEILAPAGNAKCAAAAIDNGADAVYLGYRAYSARAGAENFDGEALEEILKKAHFAGVKVYVAMNTLVKESETEEFVKTLLEVWNSGADAIIMQDVLLGRFVHERLQSQPAGILYESYLILRHLLLIILPAAFLLLPDLQNLFVFSSYTKTSRKALQNERDSYSVRPS